jgi:hypothetical protein
MRDIFPNIPNAIEPEPNATPASAVAQFEYYYLPRISNPLAQRDN